MPNRLKGCRRKTTIITKITKIMKKSLFGIFMLCVVTIFMSCANKANKDVQCNEALSEDSTEISSQGDEGSLSLKPKTTKVKGELGFCYDVLEKEYELTDNNGETALLTVELKMNDNGIPFNPSLAATYANFDEGGYIAVGFGIEIIDDKGVVVDETFAGNRGKDTPQYAEDGIKLVNMQPGQTGTLRFIVHNVKNINKDCSFTVTSVFEEI